MLGLKDDEHTRLAFASESHVCYRSGKAKPISVEHQRQFCLEKEHSSCPIFLNAGVQRVKPARQVVPVMQKPVNVSGPILAEVVGTDVGEDKTPRQDILAPLASNRFAHLWEFAGVTIFILILLAGWWLFNNRDLFFPNHTPVQASIVITPSPSPVVTNTEVFFPNSALVAELTANPILTGTPDASITPTPTSSPTSTNTSTHTPLPTSSPTAIICQAPYGWVTYSVRFGETLAYFANYFNINTDSLIEANCLEASSISAGQTIFLPWTPYPPTRTPTLTSTNTAIPPTLISTRTPTATLTMIPSNTATLTLIPSTATDLPTPTEIPFTPTDTEEPLPTLTHEFPPTRTPSNT